MTDAQRRAIFKEHFERWTQIASDSLKEAKDGVITLKLYPSPDNGINWYFITFTTIETRPLNRALHDSVGENFLMP